MHLNIVKAQQKGFITDLQPPPCWSSAPAAAQSLPAGAPLVSNWGVADPNRGVVGSNIAPAEELARIMRFEVERRIEACNRVEACWIRRSRVEVELDSH
jgi:hypothetical protein